MKRTLMNCDQVFDVLTRGPFPSGDPDDEAVERHLRACHECRQLAEALRPAVSLLHEAISADEALELPEYQGALPWKRPDRRKRLSMARLAKSDTKRSAADSSAVRASVSSASPVPSALTALRVVAASLLVFASGALLFAISFAPQHDGPSTADIHGARENSALAAKGIPTANGLITLASLNLPSKCLPTTHRPASPEDAAQIAAALENGSLASLRCCTECHHAGQKHSGSAARLVAITQQNCQACHRG